MLPFPAEDLVSGPLPQLHPATFPVIEVFGPTIQGEGPDAGRPVDFIRFGGCDYRCSWCDSMFAVEPAQVREHAEKLTAGQIIGRVLGLGSPARRIVISGGNPALLELGELVRQLRLSGRQVAVETQGSVWRHWLADVDTLVVSPKPPSSGMESEAHDGQTRLFMVRALSQIGADKVAVVLKVVVFTAEDYGWAQEVHARYPKTPFYVSAGTPVTDPSEHTAMTGDWTRDEICERFGWLAGMVAHDAAMRDVVVLPQLHVLAFGTGRGV